jgi:hypothetical protein
MRSIPLITIGLVFFGLAAIAQEKKPPDKSDAGKAAAKEEKPAVRSVQVKSGALQFDVRLEPGAPDPGELVRVTIDMNEIPPVPDPIYGERIPVKEARITAKVTDADGAGYTMAYQVHPLQDAGSYGFHFTPIRKDNYKLVLQGNHNNVSFEPDLRVPVGIWPFTKVDAKGNVSKVPAETASSRMPALPTGMKSPAMPTGTRQVDTGNRPGETPLQQAMETIGEQYAEAGVALMAGRRPDLKDAKVAAGKLKTAVVRGAAIPHSDSEFAGLMNELLQAVEKLEKVSGAGKAKAAIDSLNRIGSHHCNRCHFKMRWGILGHTAAFPADVP